MLIAGSVIIGRREGEDAKRKAKGERERVGGGGAGVVASGADVSCSSFFSCNIVDFEMCERWTNAETGTRGSTEGGVEEEGEVKLVLEISYSRGRCWTNKSIMKAHAQQQVVTELFETSS